MISVQHKDIFLQPSIVIVVVYTGSSEINMNSTNFISLFFQMESHLSEKCPMTEVICPYAEAGCPFQVCNDEANGFPIKLFQPARRLQGNRTKNEYSYQNA